MFMAGVSGIIPGTNSVAVGAPDGTDPYWDDVILLLGFEGSDGSTAVTDESPDARGNATISGNAQIDTAQFKFGSSSLLLDGTGDDGQYSNTGDFRFTAATPFTVEAWVRFNALTGPQTITSAWNTSFNNRCWLFDFSGSTTNKLRFAYSTTGANTIIVEGDWTPSTNTWYFVAADCDGANKLRLYADGTMVGSATSIPDFHNTTPPLRVGSMSSTQHFNGWIDELRITKGVARYASDGGHSVPTAAFPRS